MLLNDSLSFIQLCLFSTVAKEINGLFLVTEIVKYTYVDLLMPQFSVN